MRITAIIAVILVGSLVSMRAADDALDAAKSLYLSAAYDEALAALEKLPAEADADQADKYRALCYLGLNQNDAAERALEQLVTRRPLFKADPLDSPKLVDMLREARTRTLPAVAKALYAGAKDALDRGELAAASHQFSTLVALLSLPEAASQPQVADMGMLAEGFVKLIDQQLASKRAAAAPDRAATAPQGAPPSPPAAGRGGLEHGAATAEASRVYSATDADVTPPVPLVQTMPRWEAQSGAFARTEFSGTLEIVVDEQGTVASAVLTQRLNPSYDQRLLNAVAQWRYRPATRGGKPVKYRRTVAIVLTPGGTASQGRVE